MRVASSGSGGKDCKAGLEIWTEANTSQLENANKAKPVMSHVPLRVTSYRMLSRIVTHTRPPLH
jgi:hypothetical protein